MSSDPTLLLVMESKQQKFMQLYEPVHDGFVRYCQIRSFGKYEVEDLVQESILVAYERFESIEDPKAFLAYLMRIASNKVSDVLRKKQAESGDNEPLQSLHLDPAMATELALMFEKIDLLPENMREALLLYELQGYSMKEIAQMMDISEGAAKVLTHRSRKRLKKMMEEKRVTTEISALFALMF